MATKTSAEIKAHLKMAIEQSPACQRIRFDITVRRFEDKRRRASGEWYADVRPVKGKPEDAEAREQAIMDIIQKAQEDLELVLDETAR